MAQRKKTTKKKVTTKINWWKEPKYRMISGLFVSMFSLLAFVALFSYLFTWQADQDKVIQLSWNMLFDTDVEVENGLGRLGALVSHMFIFWGFGIPSFIAVFLGFNLGWRLFIQKGVKPWFGRLINGIFIMVLLSTVLEFAFRQSGFSWGGAFGEGLCHWLSNFLGEVGLFILISTFSLAYMAWLFDVNIGEFSFGQIKSGINWNWIPTKEKVATAITPDREMKADFMQSANSATSETAVKPKIGTQQTLDLGAQEDLPIQTLKPKNPSPKRDMAAELSLELIKSPKSTDTGESTASINKTAKSDDGMEIVKPAPGIQKVGSLIVEQDDHSKMEAYDPTLDLSNYRNPGADLLVNYEDEAQPIDREELEYNKNQIITSLLNYKIEITKIRATIGPTVTLYEIVPAPGVRISKIKNLEDDIALSLAALGIRIIAPIPGKGTIGIEVPNKNPQTVSLKEVILSEKFKNTKMALPIALGKTISNEVFVADLAKMPHLLVAGATGQGKSVGINTILMSLLYKQHPSQLKLVLVDPKKVELYPYAKLIKHYLAMLPGQDEPIITDTTKVIYTVNSLCIEMDQRYDLLKQARTRNIKEYNAKFTARKLNPDNGHRFLPFIVLVIDEFADLIMTAGKEIELPIGRLAQLARAVGIHLIIATQRPSVNIITGIIKANFPARLGFKVTSKIDSRTILDAGGADQLIGRGDMLLSVGGNMVRLQCAFVDTPEVERVIDFIGDQQGYPTPFFLPEYSGDEDKSVGSGGIKLSELDSVFEEAARLVVSQQHGSTSMIQRRLKLGYNRAGRIMDQMESLRIVGPAVGSKPREVLMFSEIELDRFLEEMKATS